MTDGEPERLPPSGAAPRAAATVVLVREAEASMEVLLLRRNRATGFVPGAYVFPGGRVDARDADADLLARLDGIDGDAAAARLQLPSGDPPAVAYYVAAAREAFEETAILVSPSGVSFQHESDRVRLRSLRDELMGGAADFGDVLDRLGARLDGGAIEYIAHWVTPEAEPRRYDTRFFAAVVPPGTEPSPDPREMTDSQWLEPTEALAQQAAGNLPMIFPTIRTLEDLSAFSSPTDLLAHYREKEIRRIMPTIFRTSKGIEINVVDD